MTADDAMELSFDLLVERYFNGASRARAATPHLRLLIGATTSGSLEQVVRDQHVLVDALDVFDALRQGRDCPFPGPLQELLDIVGGYVAARAVRQRRNILTVLPDDTDAAVQRLMASMLQAGYRVEVSHVLAGDSVAPSPAVLASAAACQCAWLQRAAQPAPGDADG